MPVFTYFILILTVFLWGGTFIAGRLLTEVLSPYSAAFLRFVIATISLAGLMLIKKEPFPKPSLHDCFGYFLLGLSGIFLYNIFFFSGLHLINAGRASLIIATTPLIITLFSTLFMGTSLSLVKSTGILVSFFGAILVITNGHPSTVFSSGFGKGELYMLGCVLSWTSYTLIGKKILSRSTPLCSVCYSSLAGTLLLFIPASCHDLFQVALQLKVTDWFALFYLGFFGTAIGFTLYYRGIQNIGPTRAGIFINLVPVFAILLAWLLLDEAIKPSVLTGGLLVLTGVTMTNHITKQPVHPAKPKETL